MSSSYFITGTGTDIGKTYLAEQMILKLKHKGKSISVSKPIVTGFDDDGENDDTDTYRLLEALGHDLSMLTKTAKDDLISSISSYRFKAPLSPDMAADLENREISLEQVVEICQYDEKFDIHIIEAAGGVMTPINKDHTMLDLISAITPSPRLILVCGSYLGAISHTLTAYEAIKARDIDVYRVVINAGITHSNAPDLDKTIKTLSSFIGTPIVTIKDFIREITNE